jgi:hypothetical protein
MVSQMDALEKVQFLCGRREMEDVTLIHVIVTVIRTRSSR